MRNSKLKQRLFETELRIGNFITVHGELQEVCHIPLPANCTDDVTKPILLTEEWLIKLGFKRSGFNFDLSNVQIIYEKENEFRFAYTCSGIRFLNVYFNRQIKYVHELQNLYFALTGEELNIT